MLEATIERIGQGVVVHEGVGFGRARVVDLARLLVSIFCPNGSYHLVQLVHITQSEHKNANDIHSRGRIEQAPTLGEECTRDVLVTEAKERGNEAAASHHGRVISEIINDQTAVGHLDGTTRLDLLAFLDDLRLSRSDSRKIFRVEGVEHALLLRVD